MWGPAGCSEFRWGAFRCGRMPAWLPRRRVLDRDIATLVSYPCPIDVSKKINILLGNTETWKRFSEKARARAVTFTWEKTARRIVDVFEELHQKKKLFNPNRLLNVFTPAQPLEEEQEIR